MQIRFQSSSAETCRMTTQQLCDNFLIRDLMLPGKIGLCYSHFDRMIIGGAVPTSAVIELPNEAELKANYFLERREMGDINIGGKGTVTAERVVYELEHLECVYPGKGAKAVQFCSKITGEPARFYFLSVPAHHSYPNRKLTKTEATPVGLGEALTSNKRTILHCRSVIPGTGIGLAICKKVVQNHSGFIDGVGEPGEGAVFTVYLPAGSRSADGSA